MQHFTMPNHSMYTLCLVTRQAKSPTITKCHHHAHDMDEHGTEKERANPHHNMATAQGVKNL